MIFPVYITLIQVVLISLFCNGIYLLYNFSNLFEPVRLWYVSISGGIQRNDGRITWAKDPNGKTDHPIKIFFYKPLFGCITCMASIWGTLGYWVINPFTIQSLIMYPIIIVCCASMNLLINRQYE